MAPPASEEPLSSGAREQQPASEICSGRDASVSAAQPAAAKGTVLLSSDKQLFDISEDAAQLSSVIAGALEALGDREAQVQVPVDVHSDVLAVVASYCKIRAEDGEPSAGIYNLIGDLSLQHLYQVITVRARCYATSGPGCPSTALHTHMNESASTTYLTAPTPCLAAPATHAQAADYLGIERLL